MVGDQQQPALLSAMKKSRAPQGALRQVEGDGCSLYTLAPQLRPLPSGAVDFTPTQRHPVMDSLNRSIFLRFEGGAQHGLLVADGFKGRSQPVCLKVGRQRQQHRHIRRGTVGIQLTQKP